MTDKKGDRPGRCPMTGANTSIGDRSVQDWWPNQLNLKILQQNPPMINPMGEKFNYAKEFKKLTSRR